MLFFHSCFLLHTLLIASLQPRWRAENKYECYSGYKWLQKVKKTAVDAVKCANCNNNYHPKCVALIAMTTWNSGMSKICKTQKWLEESFHTSYSKKTFSYRNFMRQSNFKICTLSCYLKVKVKSYIPTSLAFVRAAQPHKRSLALYSACRWSIWIRQVNFFNSLRSV